jgi:hypothetical protein
LSKRPLFNIRRLSRISAITRAHNARVVSDDFAQLLNEPRVSGWPAGRVVTGISEVPGAKQKWASGSRRIFSVYDVSSSGGTTQRSVMT